ncbi:MAG: N-acetylglucosamine-6-phosphate deacetylase [Clostridia bacterium]|nr:N-acetylglucosamine-6-phosphate deacetylase [Clostridia bacterium]
MNNNLIIKNARIITENEIIENGIIIIKNGMISEIGSFINNNCDFPVFDAENKYVSPGFIDIHTHGSYGNDFMDGDVDGFLSIAKNALLHGATTIIPTTVACGDMGLNKVFSTFREAKKLNKNGADMPGLNLEGPFLSKEQRGAQPLDFLRSRFERSEILKILDMTDDILRWSVAPELEGVEIFKEEVEKRNIIMSFAHSSADCKQTEYAVSLGFKHFTHLYSGMSVMTRIKGMRIAGGVEGAFLCDDATVEIITDGMHLPYELIRLVYKIKGADKIALISDSIRAAGLSEGDYLIGSKDEGQKIIVKNGVAWMPDFEAFAGSIATADVLLRTAIKAGIPLIATIKMLTKTPAKIMKLDDRIGSFNKGLDADIVIFDTDYNIKNVIKNGALIN